MPTSRKDLSNLKQPSVSTLQNLDALMEEYTSKLEQRLMAQTQQLKTITDNAASCLFMIDAQGKATYMNPSAEHVTGYTLDEMKSRPLSQMIHGRHAIDGSTSQVCDTIRPLELQKKAKDQEDVFVRKNGQSFPVSFSVVPLQQEGQQSGAVLEFQDISERKELERQKDEFIGVASHELKTPVTSMKTYTQVLKRKFAKNGDTVAVESLEKIDAQINKLTNLIADLLDVTRVQTGNLTLRQEEFDLDDLVREVVDNIQLTTEVHQIKIDGLAHMTIYADRDRTGQVLINFLSNAIKYSPHSDTILVMVSGDDQQSTVSVQDFGIGIPKDKLDQVFERFMRVSGPKMETFPGLGLGLYISAQIIRRQGGQIWVESEPDQGSTFYFSLPKQAIQSESINPLTIEREVAHE